MRRDIASDDIADLVARAERVKRNREIILRTVQPKALTAPAATSAAISTDGHLTAYLRAGTAIPTKT